MDASCYCGPFGQLTIQRRPIPIPSTGHAGLPAASQGGENINGGRGLEAQYHRRAYTVMVPGPVPLRGVQGRASAPARPHFRGHSGQRGSLHQWTPWRGQDRHEREKRACGRVFPETDAQLAAESLVWASSEEAAFSAGRCAWVNWDVDELVGKEEQILTDKFWRSSIRE